MELSSNILLFDLSHQRVPASNCHARAEPSDVRRISCGRARAGRQLVSALATPLRGSGYVACSTTWTLVGLGGYQFIKARRLDSLEADCVSCLGATCLRDYRPL